jgi:ActR/RegA family two-component response regulator
MEMKATKKMRAKKADKQFEKVLEWFKKHPLSNIMDCSRALGIHRNTISRYLKKAYAP